jgi:hypothetical protein
MGVYLYPPTSKRATGGIFHRTSLVDLSGSRCKSLEANLISDKYGPTTRQVR